MEEEKRALILEPKKDRVFVRADLIFLKIPNM
jgi:hypothetical protein